MKSVWFSAAQIHEAGEESCQLEDSAESAAERRGRQHRVLRPGVRVLLLGGRGRRGGRVGGRR